MEITIKGELTVAELRQALYEELNRIEEELAVRYTIGATLYVRPSNGFGDAVTPHNAFGVAVNKIASKAPYRSAADEFRIK